MASLLRGFVHLQGRQKRDLRQVEMGLLVGELHALVGRYVLMIMPDKMTVVTV